MKLTVFAVGVTTELSLVEVAAEMERSNARVATRRCSDSFMVMFGPYENLRFSFGPETERVNE